MSEEQLYSLLRRRIAADETADPQEEIIAINLDQATAELFIRALTGAKDGYMYVAVPQKGELRCHPPSCTAIGSGI